MAQGFAQENNTPTDTLHIEESNFQLLFYSRRATKEEIKKFFPKIWAYREEVKEENLRPMKTVWIRQQAFLEENAVGDKNQNNQQQIPDYLINEYFEEIIFVDFRKRKYSVLACEDRGRQFLYLDGRVCVLNEKYSLANIF